MRDAPLGPVGPPCLTGEVAPCRVVCISISTWFPALPGADYALLTTAHVGSSLSNHLAVAVIKDLTRSYPVGQVVASSSALNGSSVHNAVEFKFNV